MADGAGCRFTFEGRPFSARAGQSLAAALIEAGERGFRETAKGGERSVFCGMGVCQDCLVEVDGAPNVRACMTAPREGMAVRRQSAAVDLTRLGPAPEGRLIEEAPEIAVLGGGAGGLSAARAAAEAGADVLVIDERGVAGGQYYKQAAASFALDAQQREGGALIAAATAAGARLLSGVEVWGAFEGPVLYASRGTDALVIRPKRLIVATGAYERPAMVPGWQLPGVMTTGAAQTLWRSYRTLPGERVLVAGSGPLNAQVALELARGGARVVGLLERAPSPLGRLKAAMAMVAADPRLAAKGLAMMAALFARRVPVQHDARLMRVDAAPGGLNVTVDVAGTTAVHGVDAVLMNDGFHPSNEVLRLLGATFAWDAQFRQLRPHRTERGETSVPGLFAVGDCCGLGGAPAAVAEGAIAGAAAASDLGHTVAAPAWADRQLARARRFQEALWTVYAHGAEGLADVPGETLLCRCEEVSVATLDAALAEGAGDIGAAKRATRIGMGRCQGRYCGPLLAALMAERRGEAMDERAFFAPRPPIKPVAISSVLAAEAAHVAGDDAAV